MDDNFFNLKPNTDEIFDVKRNSLIMILINLYYATIKFKYLGIILKVTGNLQIYSPSAKTLN